MQNVILVITKYGDAEGAFFREILVEDMDTWVRTQRETEIVGQQDLVMLRTKQLSLAKSLSDQGKELRRVQSCKMVCLIFHMALYLRTLGWIHRVYCLPIAQRRDCDRRSLARPPCCLSPEQ